MSNRRRTPPTKPLPHPRDVPTLSIIEAGSFLNYQRTAAYKAARRGVLPTIHITEHRRVVPTAELWRLLGLDPAAPDQAREQVVGAEGPSSPGESPSSGGESPSSGGSRDAA